MGGISIHAPRAGRDPLHAVHDAAEKAYFNPRAPCGARLWTPTVCAISGHFNPRAPCGARRYGHNERPSHREYFNPRAPCGARLQAAGLNPVLSANFNPRAPCGARPVPHAFLIAEPLFQSTRPVRGATHVSKMETKLLTDFNPRAPCGARLNLIKYHQTRKGISIHAPRAGRDLAFV